MVLPEWWGLTEYPKMRAQQLADLGYFAMAVDLYGDGKIAEDPKSAGEMAGPFYNNPKMAQARFQAALDKVATYPQADMSRVAAIGYCFGGGMALNIARLGQDLKAIISFHGSLMGVAPDKNSLKAAILICHGEADSFVKPEEVDAFKMQMDSAGINYTFKSYANATHAFTNPDATEVGKKFNMPITYNAAADSASWNDMKQFFEIHLK
ncbi:MAG: dienelactone hydrolase family protein, partial [Ferruginibacter sp.]